MNEVKMGNLLAQMQRLAASAEAAPSIEASDGANGGFAALMRASVDAVNQNQTTAADMAAAFERGDAAASLPEVMIALQKASLSFQAMTEVRNQLVNAYQEIMNMPI
jgi:flagellar hook-basal body complex protein FliE